MGKRINQPNRFTTEKWIAEQDKKKKVEQDLKKHLKKLGARIAKPGEGKGVPILKLRCIETYSDAPTNREFFTRQYVYHVIQVGARELIMQTNFPDLHATIPMNIIHKIFAGFEKEKGNDLKVIT